MKTDLVIDNSVVMAWFFRDESTKFADNILDQFENYAAIVPAIWPLEVGNVLLVAERKGCIGAATVYKLLNYYLRFRL